VQDSKIDYDKFYCVCVNEFPDERSSIQAVYISFSTVVDRKFNVINEAIFVQDYKIGHLAEFFKKIIGEQQKILGNSFQNSCRLSITICMDFLVADKNYSKNMSLSIDAEKNSRCSIGPIIANNLPPMKREDYYCINDQPYGTVI
jgi:hypothetical protein